MSGRYVLGKKLAVGGMAEIFAARVKGAGGFEKDVVVKRILPTIAGDPTFRERFFQEARLAAMLSHPNIVQTYELVEQDGETLLAMEAVNGADIATLIRVARESGKPFPVACALYIAASIADALAYAHEKKDERGNPLSLVHRDVTPSNVLVSDEGVPKLIDFGIAKAASGSAPQTQAGLVLGKAWYLSPEQCLGRLVDGKSDVFALGVVLFQMLAGRVPFGGRNGIAAMDKIAKGTRPSLSALVSVPKVVEQVVDAALIMDRELRPTAKMWRAQIERALSAVDPERRARDDLAALIQRAHERPAGSPAPVDVGPGMAGNAPTLLLMDLSAASAEAGRNLPDDDDNHDLIANAPSSPDTGDTGEVNAAIVPTAPGVLAPSVPGLLGDIKPAPTIVDAQAPDAVRAVQAQEQLQAQTQARARARRGLLAAALFAVAGAAGAVAIVVWVRSSNGDGTGAGDKDAPPIADVATELRGVRDVAPDDDGAEDDAVDDDAEDDGVIEESDGGATKHVRKTKRAKRKKSTRPRVQAVKADKPTTTNDDKANAGAGASTKVEGKGVITFHCDPWAQVWLGGKSLGMTWTGPLDVPAGKHALFLKNPVTGHEKTVNVDVKPNSRQSLYITLDKRK